MRHSNPPPSHSHITNKVPPGWDPASNSSYSFDRWQKDLIYWSMFTDLPERSQGPAVLLQLGGMAREIATEMNPADIQNGALVDWEDGNGPILTSGLHILIYTLSKRFADLAVESSISAIQNLWNFSRRGGETIHQILSRFEVTKKRANDQ